MTGGGGGSSCAGTLRLCGASCVDFMADLSNCGACGRVCGQGQVCNQGTCAVLPDDCTTTGSCGAGYFCEPVSKRCQTGCRLQTDCPAGATCTAGVCGCPAGQHACGQLCVPDAAVTSCGTTCTACPMPSNGTATCTAATSTCGVSCSAGFQPSGTSCVDVNECASGNGGCSTNATCTNTSGSRTCACRAGFTGDGVTCTDTNECATANGGCATTATCTNTPGSRTCACNSGYTGDGVSCTDTNECATANGGCAATATCTNTPGSRTCACNAGYTGTGLSCTDLNECATANGGCSANATCTNTPGSRTCACNPGTTGDGLTCVGNGDTCAGAIDLTSSTTVNGTLLGAANDYGATLPAQCGSLSPVGPDRVYRYTPATTGNFRLTLGASSWYPTVWLSSACGTASTCLIGRESYGGFDFNFHGTAGVPVFIHVDADSASVSTFTISVSPVTAPSNDLCAGATALTLGTPVTANPSGAVADYSVCGANNYYGDVVYTFTPATTGSYVFTGSSSSVGLWIRAACSEASACITTTGSNGTEQATLTAGTTYFVYARHYSNVSFTLRVDTLTTPGNDTCAAPIDLTQSTTVNGTLLGATNDYGATLPAQCGSLSPVGPEVVYRFTPATTGNFRLTLGASSWYPTVWLSSSCGTAGTCLVGRESYGGFDFNFHGTAGVPVFIHVDADSASVSTFTISVSPVTAPSNDLCAGATALTLGTPVTANPSGAVADYSVCGANNYYGDVVYTFTPATTGSYVFTGSSSSVGLWIRAACSEASACITTTGSNGTEQATLTAGTTYFVYARHYSNVSFTLRVDTLTTPGNDTCAAPIDLTQSTTVNGTLLGATNDYGATLPAQCGSLSPVGPEVVYRFTPATTGNFRLTLGASSWYPTVWLSSSCGTAGTCLVGRESYGGFDFNFHGTAGVPVFIHVDADSTNVSTFTLSVAPVTAPSNDLCAGATALTLNTPVTANPAGAVADYTVCGAQNYYGDVVYTFTPATTGSYVFTTGTSSANVWIRAACSEASTCLSLTGTSGTYQATLSAGTTYYVFARHYSNVTFTLTVQ